MNTIDAQLFAKMFLAGTKNLESKKDLINELNVFPVPDGDTGTNMSMTILSAAREVAAIEEPSFETLAKAISSGSLRGARGNSGVILSQLFRGFTKVIASEEVITIPLMADAFEKAVKTAYKAVMQPKEGTILTVSKGASTKARELADAGCDDMETFLGEIVEHTTYVLSTTPDLLPVLKQAGVVDSGGQGFVQVLTGWYDVVCGKEIDYINLEVQSDANIVKEEVIEIKYGYNTEFTILTKKPMSKNAETTFKAYLEEIGDSITVARDVESVKVQLHTEDPGFAIQRALTYGQLDDLRIENMRLAKDTQANISEVKTEVKFDEPRKDFGFIAVAVGEGMAEIFTSLGVDYLIEGGQTMNPSTEDMLTAINNVNAENIFILPNNSNIILAANQAKALTKDKNIIVIPTKTVPQGIAAVVSFSEKTSVQENEENMLIDIKKVKTGSITYAVRDTMIDNKTIKCGDYMGIADKGILSVGTDMTATILEMVDEMVDNESELISIYYGEDISEEDASKVCSMIQEKYSACDVELQSGGQPVYYYVISIE